MEKHREKLTSLCEIQYGYAFDSEKEFGVIRPESLLRGRDSL